MTMTDLFRPSRATSGNPLNALARALEIRIGERRARKGISQMLDLDDHMLRDVGLTRNEIHRATHMPLSFDAATELHRISLARSRPNL